MKTDRSFICIAGPTGSGKSRLALELALAIDGEIINCDSVSVYRGFDIGTAKPTIEERQRVPHHLLDIAEWHEEFDAAKYAKMAHDAAAEVKVRGKTPIVVGGTGLYLRALMGQEFHELPRDQGLRAEFSLVDTATLYARLEALDPERADDVHPNDRVRVMRALEIVTLTGKTFCELKAGPVASSSEEVFVLDPPRPTLHEAILGRSRAMLELGLIEEVRGHLASGVSPRCKPMQSIGYKQTVDYIEGRIAEAELLPKIVAATRQYAKRQTTWFKKTPGAIFLKEWSAASLGQRLWS